MAFLRASKRVTVSDAVLVGLQSDTAMVLSGGVVTDAGAAESKVNVSLVAFMPALPLRAGHYVAAVTNLSVLDGDFVYINPGTAVGGYFPNAAIQAGASVPAGSIKLAQVAVAGGVATPTQKRRMFSVTAEI